MRSDVGVRPWRHWQLGDVISQSGGLWCRTCKLVTETGCPGGGRLVKESGERPNERVNGRKRQKRRGHRKHQEKLVYSNRNAGPEGLEG